MPSPDTGRELTAGLPEGATCNAHGIRCPRCKAPLYRIRRRLIDRIVSRFTLVFRYQCSNYCGWEGNLRQARLARPAHGINTHA